MTVSPPCTGCGVTFALSTRIYRIVFVLFSFSCLCSTVIIETTYETNHHEGEPEATYGDKGTVIFGQSTTGSHPNKWQMGSFGGDGCADGTDIICVLTFKNTATLFHAAHAALSLFPCWSLFLRADEENTHTAPLRRVFMLEPDVAPFGIYGQQAAAAMQAIIVHNTTESAAGVCGRTGMFPAVSSKNWFDNNEYAGKLREHVLGHTIPQEDKNFLRVGLLNRHMEDWRSMVNIKQISAAMDSLCDDMGMHCIIETMYYDGLSFLQQADWMAKQNVVITAHGNQATNVGFIRPCTVFLELFPPVYFVPWFYQTLGIDAKGLSFFLYLEVTRDEMLASAKLNAGQRRNVNLNYTSHDILQNWDIMMSARQDCLYQLQ